MSENSLDLGFVHKTMDDTYGRHALHYDKPADSKPALGRIDVTMVVSQRGETPEGQKIHPSRLDDSYQPRHAAVPYEEMGVGL